MKTQPATPEHLSFLDNLRESGVTNMFGATPYLLRKFPDMDRHTAADVLSEWMRTYGERHPG